MTTLKLGWTDPMTGAFGAHPILGSVLDLNDGQTFTLVSPEGLALSPARRTLVPTGNVRTQGERITRAIYRHNREAKIRLVMGPGTSYAAFIATVRSLASWLDAAPAVPFAVQWQPPSATSPVYLDVVGAAHAIPTDESQWLRLQVEPIEVVLVVRPGLRGDRVTLQNLVTNPGFEAPSGPSVTVFSDDFTNTNAYTLVSGAATSVASGQMTIPANTTVQFGSVAWSAVHRWSCRFQATSTGAIEFILHDDGAGNFIDVYIGNTGLYLTQGVSSVTHDVGTASFALTAGSWYWMQLSELPSAPGTQCDLFVQILVDNAGAPTGAVVASVGPVATYDGSSGFSGKAEIKAFTTSMVIGGAYPSVHTMGLFGPGGWAFSGSGGSGSASGAWEQDTANTYDGGPVTSFGAARIDAAPAGTLSAYWETYAGGAPAGTGAIPATVGQQLGASAVVRSSGVALTCSQELQVTEYDSGGAFLTLGTVASLTGAHAAWATLSGSYSVQNASCAYVAVRLAAVDATSGSANGSIWFDNVQFWNISSTGQSSMPYCELRFPQAPAQLLVSGLLGDLPAPAHLAFATYCTSFAPAGVLNFALGRRAQASKNARLVGPSIGFYGTALAPTSTAYLDSTSYGGYCIQASVTSSGWNPRAFSFTPADLLGVYHLFSRFLTQQGAGNIGNVKVRVVTQQKSGAWYGALDGSDVLGTYYGPYAYPVSQSNVWTPADAGQVNVPALPAGARTDLAQNDLTPRSQWVDLTGGGSVCRCNWQVLVPVDGSLLVGVVNNASNALYTVANEWLWVYVDGLLVNRAGALDGPATTFSLESSVLPNPARGGGGPGTQYTGSLNVNMGADPYLALDPTIGVPGGAPGVGEGVNQLAGYIADGQGNVLPLHTEIQYDPLYLWPR